LFITLLIVVACAYTAVTSWFWFSGTKWPYGQPVEREISASVAKLVVPGTIIVADGSQEDGKFVYLLQNFLADPAHRPNLWIKLNLLDEGWREIVEDPIAAAKNFNGKTWQYQWTQWREQVDEIKAFKDWKQVIFLFQNRLPPEVNLNSMRLELAKSLCKSPLIKDFPRSQANQFTHTVVVCQVSDLKRKQD